jgi:transketolase
VTFDIAAAKERCRRYRRRILDISQQVSALHIASAYSCTEIVDCIYHGLMRPQETFILSKGHAGIMQYVVLEDLRVLNRSDLEAYCTRNGVLGTHPDYGNPGIAASTGSLGHGLGMAVGMALANRSERVYVVLSDGELQEGSTWEAILQASSLRLNNLTVFVDNNDFQSLQRTSVTHPSFYPLAAKFVAFDWGVVEVEDGHDSWALYKESKHGHLFRPFVVIAKTTKGKGVSFMENIPIWHYRSPNVEEYAKAIAEL